MTKPNWHQNYAIEFVNKKSAQLYSQPFRVVNCISVCSLSRHRESPCSSREDSDPTMYI